MRLSLRFLTLTPTSLQVYLFVIAIATIGAVVGFVPRHETKTKTQPRPAFSYKSQPTKLSTSAVSALQISYDQEYELLYRYQTTVEKFGLYGPYQRLIYSQQLQTNALEQLAKKYEITLKKPSSKKIPFSSYSTSVCLLNGQKELEFVKIQERNIIPSVDEYKNISSVLQNMATFTKNYNLKLISRCK